MNKALIFQDNILHYKILLFNSIGKDPDIKLSVAYDAVNKFNNSSDDSFRAISCLNKKIWKLFWIKNMRSLIKDYDQMIFTAGLRWLPTFIILFFIEGKTRFYFSGIGISSEKGIRRKPFLDIHQVKLQQC